MCNDACVRAAVFPAMQLETFAFGKGMGGGDKISSDGWRHLARRLVALVAPILYMYEFCVSIIRIPVHLVTFFCSVDELKDLLLDKDVGAITYAFTSLRHCFSSICEIPQKLLCGHSVNYFGKKDRYGDSNLENIDNF